MTVGEIFDRTEEPYPLFEEAKRLVMEADDKASGIKNDPNDWSDDPRYSVDLLRRVVRVSLESVRIVAGFPGLGA